MKRYLLPLGVLLLLVMLWEYAVRILHIDKFILPAPSRILEALINSSALLIEHSSFTGKEALLGFLLAVFLGMFLATVMSLIDIVKETIYPLVIVSQTVPIIALSPLLIIWFGYGILPKVMVVTLVCFFPITVSFFEGLAKVDADTVKVLEAMGANKLQVFRKVQFPAALPALFSGLKISAAYSVMGAVIGEWLGASKGLGIFLTRSMHSFQTEQVFAAIIVISVLSLIFFGIVEITGRLCMPWYYKDYKWQREHSEEQEE